MFNWLVVEHGIGPHIPTFNKLQHTDSTFPRDDFDYDYKCEC
jgi:hypothetical protein